MPEVRVTGYLVVVDQIIIGRQRNRGLNFQCHGIHQRRINDVVRKLIAYPRTIRRESCGSRVVNRVSQNRAPERVHGRLSVHDELWQERLAEISAAVSQSRNRCNSRIDELGFAELLKIEEEETLAVAVVQLS